MCLVMVLGRRGAKHMAHAAPLQPHRCRVHREFCAPLPSGAGFCDSDLEPEARRRSKVLQFSWIFWEWAGGISAYGGCKKPKKKWKKKKHHGGSSGLWVEPLFLILFLVFRYSEIECHPVAPVLHCSESKPCWNQLHCWIGWRFSKEVMDILVKYISLQNTQHK